MPRVKRRKQPVPIPSLRYSVLTIGVPAGDGGQKATVRAVELLRRHGYGAGILNECINAEAAVAIRDVVSGTQRAVAAEAKPAQPTNEGETDGS